MLALDDRRYVGINAFLNSLVLLLGIECTLARSQLHTHVCAFQINANGDDGFVMIDFDVDIANIHI